MAEAENRQHHTLHSRYYKVDNAAAEYAIGLEYSQSSPDVVAAVRVGKSQQLIDKRYKSRKNG